MSKISGSKKNSTVKIVISLFCASSLSISPTNSFAQDKSNPTLDFLLARDAESKAEAKEARQAAACKEAREKIATAERNIGAACRKAGIGNSETCASRARSCAETAGGESFETTDAIATVLGLPADAKIGERCPQYNGRDYADEKKRLQQEIKDLEEDIAKLGEDKADIEKDFNDAIQELQQGLTDAQQELESEKTRLDEEEREKLAEFQSSQSAAKEQLRERNSKILSLRAEVTNAIREKATKMLELTAETSKYACTQEYTKAAEAYGKVSAKSSASHMAKAKNQKAAALDAFNKCMNRFQQARISLNEQSQAKLDSLNDQINSTQSSIDDLNDSLNLASTQLEQMKQDTTKKKTAAEKKVTDLMTLTQNKMTAAQQDMQTRLQALATRQQSLTSALNRANMSMAQMGIAPSSRSAEYTPAEASGEIESEISVIESIAVQTELDGYSCGGIRKEAEKKAKKYRGTR